LELTRYIHLNPLRASLVEDLKSLDKYQWAGHSVLIGKQKNPLVPEIPPAIEEDNYLAEKTVEDVLKHFGQKWRDAGNWQDFHLKRRFLSYCACRG
jgi:hypothetical protein